MGKRNAIAADNLQWFGGIWMLFIVHFLRRLRKRNQKKAPVSRALRVCLRVVSAVGRAETRPASSRAQTVAAS